jgi:hypothetical protein
MEFNIIILVTACAVGLYFLVLAFQQRDVPALIFFIAIVLSMAVSLLILRITLGGGI